jgi:hypothetical protein
MKPRISFFYDHLIPPGPYQSVLERVGAGSNAERVIQKILFLSVSRAIFASITDPELQSLYAQKAVSGDPTLLTTLARSQPEISTIVRQTLDRTLLALTSALQ